MVPDTIGDLGSILGVWAHPDDEAWLSAGLMAQAVDAGRRVVCVTATAGEAGFPDDDPRPEEERMAIRRAEMAASLGEVGVTEHHWLGYRDGHCDEVPDEEAVEIIAGLIADVQPDVLLTFGPDGGTGHVDHIAVCRWSTMACARSATAPRLLYATKSRGVEPRVLPPDRSVSGDDGRGHGSGRDTDERDGDLVQLRRRSARPESSGASGPAEPDRADRDRLRHRCVPKLWCARSSSESPVPPIRMSRAVSRRTLLPKDLSSAKRGTFGSDR